MKYKEKIMLIPMVIEQSGNSERAYDIYSRLLKDRIIFIGDVINNNVANTVTAQLLFLQNDDSKKDINMYINSPGGEVTSGLAIYDTMQFIKPDVATFCIGQATSMGAILLTGGAKGKRYSLPHSRIMIHQPLGGVSGQVTDINIQATEITRIRLILETIISKHTGKSLKIISKDCDRDHFMNPEDAMKYGLIDKVILGK